MRRQGMSSYYVRIHFLVCEFQREFQREESRARQALGKAGKNDRKTGRGCLSWGARRGMHVTFFLDLLEACRKEAVSHLRHTVRRHDLKDFQWAYGVWLDSMRPR